MFCLHKGLEAAQFLFGMVEKLNYTKVISTNHLQTTNSETIIVYFRDFFLKKSKL